MDQPKQRSSAFRTLPILAVLMLLTVLAIAPVFFVSEAQNKGRGKGLVERTKSHDDGIPNYDIRLDKSANRTLVGIRERLGRSAVSIADKREKAAEAETELRSKVRGLKVTYGRESNMPEVIAPSEKLGSAALVADASGSRADILRRFMSDNNALFGLDGGETERLSVSADYTNPEGGMSFVNLEQKVNGIPVFAGEVRAGFSKSGALVRVVNDLASGASDGVSSEFGDPRTAFRLAARSVGRDDQVPSASQAGDDASKVAFGEGDFAPTAEKVYFPTEPGVLVPAWRILLWEPINAYYLIVDAESETVLWRKNITEDQTQAVTYSVYTNGNAMINVAENPAPLTPGPISPILGTQGALLNRTSVNLIGNEGLYSFNNLGWITDNASVLDGNAVQAGPDRDCILASPGVCQTASIPQPSPSPPLIINVPNNGVDANVAGTAFRNFSYAYNPGPGNPAPGDSPMPAGTEIDECSATPAATTDYQKGAAVQLFYITNRYHDEMYRLGFTEQARNFQANNFGRGGSQNDRISAESQDCSGVNNANFSTPPDGSRGRMQMYIFDRMSPDRDGSLDADIVIHELTHGLSNRLHGNSAGLGTNMARGMGEGWSDFYAHAMLSEPNDPINGIYTTGGYATYQLYGAGFTSNYYYGIRRFPKAVIAFTGGPNNRPHNPLTFADIDQTQISLSDGAFSPAFGITADQVHAAGEVWSSMLWEVRARYVQRLGWADGNRRILQHVTDGMKLSPLNPTFITARDSILAAALASGTQADVSDIWAGFALRGLGASASISNPGSSGGGSTRVTEAFDLPNLQQPGMTVSDAQGNNNGYAEPGETVRLTIPLENLTGINADNVSVELDDGQQLSYGSIAHNGSASNDFDYTLSPNLACGSVVDVTINVTSTLGPVSFVRKILTGAPVVTATENFDGVTAPAIPAGWQIVNDVNGGLNPFVTSTTTPNSAPNAAFAPNPDAESGVNGSTSLTSPEFAIQSQAATVSFRHRYNTEPNWDGGVLEISIDGGAYQDILDAGGSFTQNGYSGFLNDNDNPIDLRNAWTGNSGGYLTTVAQLPTSAAGKNVRLRWRFGTDNNTGAEGWFVDNIAVSGQSQCSFAATSDTRADFDGDGRTDFAIFRPTDSIWYILFAHGEGFTGVGWGTNGDIPVPADYDNDGKTDVAVYRPGQGGDASYFYALRSSDLTFAAVPWGQAGDIPVVRDYDGDGLADFAVHRPTTGVWYVYEADGGFQVVPFGAPGAVPIAGDFDGDGKADFTILSDGVWYVFKSSTADVTGAPWGLPTDVPVPADYDGDGKDDFAVFRPSDGMWWVLRSSDLGFSGMAWGQAGDVPIPGDYDGDGKYDPAIYRDGIWAVTYSSTGSFGGVGFGTSTDIPAAKAYIP